MVIAEVEGGANQRPGGRVDVIGVLGPDFHQERPTIAGGVAELDDLYERHWLARQVEITRRRQALVVVLLERDLLAGDGRLQQGVSHDARQSFAASRIFRQHLQMPIGRLVSDVRRHRPDHLLGHQFAGLHAVDDFRWAIVMDADLVQIHVLAGLRVGPEAFEDLDRDRVIGAPELLGDGLVERRLGRRVVEYRQVGRCHETGVAGRALPEYVGLSGVEGFLKDHGFMDVQPQRPLVLVRNRCEGFPGGVVENVVLETVDDVLAGAVRQQHDPFGHFFNPLPLAHTKSREHSLHLFTLFFLGLLGVRVRHGQAEFIHHEFTEHRRRQVAQELAQVFCIVHLHTPQRFGSAWYQPRRPLLLVGVCRPMTFGVPNDSDCRGAVMGLSSRYEIVRRSGIIFGLKPTNEEMPVPSPLGDKIRALRKQKKLSLEQLAELTDSSKSYIWELENKDDPKPSAEKIGKIAAVLEVTTEFLLTESATTPDEEVLDEAFFRKYKNMSEPDKKKIRKILDAWEDE